MLSAILTKRTGMSLLEYLRPRLLEPLGISGATWETCPQGICVGGWGLSVRTEDIACFGQAYLQNGMWQAKSVVPAAWVQEATRGHIQQGPGQVDWMQGYGYQFWRCQHGAYRGDGAFGQYCVVMPEQDAVLALTGGLGDMQKPLDLVWKHLLPAMKPQALPQDRAGEKALRERLAGLGLAPAPGDWTNATARQIDGKIFTLAAPDGKTAEMSLQFGTENATLVFKSERGAHRLECGYGCWCRGRTTLRGPQEEAVASSGAWMDDQTWVAKLCFYQTPYMVTVTCRFEGREVSVEGRQNVSFGPAEVLSFTGRMARGTQG
jgi:hypothetical protein